MKALNNFNIGRISIASILLGTLTLPIALNCNVSRANALIAEDARFQAQPLAQTQADDNKYRSMDYVKSGWEAQKRGDKVTAIEHYLKAVELDEENAYAYLTAATLVGHTAEGITCMKTAAFLFDKQQNEEGYNIAIQWLKEGNSEGK